MKAVILALVIASFVILVSSEGKHRKLKKYAERKFKQPVPQEFSEPQHLLSELEESEPNREVGRNPDILEAVDLCDGKCGSGQVCEISNGFAMCMCIPSCPEEKDPRRKVCSNLNTTWGSDCELHQMRCWCRGEEKNCVGDSEKQKHMHIDYYGECHEPKECTKDEMDDFPKRMREWLFNVMRDAADREELSSYYLKMEREAETDIGKRWTNAVFWKFCDLDKSNDRAISRHEIFPIRAPLLSLEQCIAPFLDKCDADNNHKISMKEWGKCLEVNEDEIEDICEEIRGN